MPYGSGGRLAELKHIAHCFSPINVMAAAAAIEHLHPKAHAIVDIVIYHPGLPRPALEQIANFARRAAKSLPAIRNVVVLDDNEWRDITDADEQQQQEALRSIFRTTTLDAILYAHDVVGDFLDIVARSYPHAKRVCFGDAMGQVFERDVHLSFLRARPEPAGFARRWLQRLFEPKAAMPGIARALPDKAVLMLPVDQSGNILTQIPFEIFPAPAARALFKQVASEFGELRDYLTELAGADPGDLCVFLTENWAEGSFIPFEREIEFYATIIQALPDRIKRVLVKPHPAETRSRVAALRDRLGSKRQIVESEAAFARLPFELWAAHLPEQTEIVAMQYPALSLKYLYGRSVIQPFDHKLIETYFDPSVQNSFKNALDLNMLPLARLDRWDGRSPLYCGR